MDEAGLRKLVLGEILQFPANAGPATKAAWNELMQRQFPADVDADWWLDAAGSNEPRHLVALFCLGNYFVLDDGSSHDRTFAATLLLGATFFRLAAFDSVVKVLQAALGLSSDRSDDDVLSIAASNVGTFGIERALSAYGVLADALVAKSRHEQAVGLLESVLMLAPGCYRTSELNRRLAPVIERVDGLITSRPIRVLADSLLEAGRSGDAVALLQRYLGIEDQPYEADAVISALGKTSQRLSYNNVTSLLDALALALQHECRFTDALIAREAWFGVKQGGYLPGQIYDRFERLIQSVRWPNFSAGILRLSGQLRYSGRASDALSLLEACIFLATENAVTFRRDVEEVLSDSYESALLFKIEYLQVVSDVNGPQVALDGWNATFREAGDSSCELIDAMVIAAIREDVAPTNWHVACGAFAELLAKNNRFDDSVQLLEVLFGLSAPYDAVVLTAAIRSLQSQISASALADNIMYLLEGLIALGREAEAEVVAQAWKPSSDLLIGAGNLSSDRAVKYFTLLATRARRDHWRDFRSIVQSAVDYLRRGYRSEHSTLEDRRRLVQHLSQCRDEIAKAAIAYCRGDERQDVDVTRGVQFLLWDEELGERLTIERLILSEEEVKLDASKITAPIATNFWPFADELFVSGNDAAKSSVDRSLPPSRPIVTGTDRAWRRQAEVIVARGVDERTLAAALGRDVVFLKLSCVENDVVWTAFRSDGSTLQVVATSARALKGGRSDLDAVLCLHALRIRIHLASKEHYLDWFETQRQRLVQIRDKLDSFDPNEQAEAMGLVLEYFHAFAQSDASNYSIRSWETLLGRLAIPENRGRWTIRISGMEKPQAAQVWRQIISELIDYANGRIDFDNATERLVADIGEVLQLGSLETLLDPIDGRLVIQAGEGLQAIPFAYVPINGHPIFQLVGQLRTTFSLYFEVVQCELRSNLSQHASDNVLVATWFPSAGTAGAFDARELHRAVHALGAVYYGLAASPIASEETVTTALAERDYAIAVVCGHGRQGGVELGPNGGQSAPSLWRGKGADLSRVELLVVVSCGLATLEASRGWGWDGFGIEQAACRSQSLIACLWPVNAEEAIRFSVAIVDAYADRRANCPSADAWRRAEALNIVRRRFWESGGVTFNTAAAFELIGQG